MVKKVTVKETVSSSEEAAENEKLGTVKKTTITTVTKPVPSGETKKTTTTKTSSTKTKKKRKPRKKRSNSSSSTTHTTTSSGKRLMTAREREQLLIENFVGLQHAMTNMSIKFGALSDNITGLLNVFEEAAKNFAAGGKSDDKDLLKKINSLLEQNKTIARGLVMMEGKLRGRDETATEPNSMPMPAPQSQNGTPTGFSTPSIGDTGFDTRPNKPLPRF